MPPFLPRIFSCVWKYHANTLYIDAATAALSSSHTPLPWPCVHLSILDICVPISVLQIGSPVLVFQIPYTCVDI